MNPAPRTLRRQVPPLEFRARAIGPSACAAICSVFPGSSQAQASSTRCPPCTRCPRCDRSASGTLAPRARRDVSNDKERERERERPRLAPLFGSGVFFERGVFSSSSKRRGENKQPQVGGRARGCRSAGGRPDGGGLREPAGDDLRAPRRSALHHGPRRARAPDVHVPLLRLVSLNVSLLFE